tara:strand:+ start:534 stop:800 length:267 start_codon:yes stop_codon:yes gene_type:complete
MKIKVDGCESVEELIHNLRNAELVLNRKPNTIIMSTQLADALHFELMGSKMFFPSPRWKLLVNGSYMGLLVKIATNRDPMYLEVFEIK